MPDNHDLPEKSEIGELSNELTYRRYLMGKGKVRGIFRKITIPEYIALHIVAYESENSEDESGRVYLKKLAEKMELEIYQASKMVGELKERGLVFWSHDGNGKEGTYVIITDTGKKLLHDQEEFLKEFYGKVIEKYGKQNLIDLLQMTKRLDEVMSSEAAAMEPFSD